MKRALIALLMIVSFIFLNACDRIDDMYPFSYVLRQELFDNFLSLRIDDSRLEDHHYELDLRFIPKDDFYFGKTTFNHHVILAVFDQDGVSFYEHDTQVVPHKNLSYTITGDHGKTITQLTIYDHIPRDIEGEVLSESVLKLTMKQVQLHTPNKIPIDYPFETIDTSSNQRIYDELSSKLEVFNPSIENKSTFVFDIISDVKTLGVWNSTHMMYYQHYQKDPYYLQFHDGDTTSITLGENGLFFQYLWGDFNKDETSQTYLIQKQPIHQVAFLPPIELDLNHLDQVIFIQDANQYDIYAPMNVLLAPDESLYFLTLIDSPGTQEYLDAIIHLRYAFIDDQLIITTSFTIAYEDLAIEFISLNYQTTIKPGEFIPIDPYAVDSFTIIEPDIK